jgi:hypothetical protein
MMMRGLMGLRGETKWGQRNRRLRARREDGCDSSTEPILELL